VSYLISVRFHDRRKGFHLRAYLRKLAVERRCAMTEAEVGGRLFFLLRFPPGVCEQETRKKLGWALARFICDHIEPDLINRMIRRYDPYRSHEEVDQIQREVLKQLKSSAWEYKHSVYADRREKLAEQVSRYLRDSYQLAVDGYVRFRMKGHFRVLASCVKEAVASYRLDQEYKEFIRLLRHFIHIQVPKVPLIHVVHQSEGGFRLLLADGRPLPQKELDEWGYEGWETPFSHEDYILSALLTAVPEHVVLHTEQPQENVIRTLLQIFKGRIMLCDGCSQCKPAVIWGEDA
jgi:putative sporulation protein YtxC